MCKITIRPTDNDLFPAAIPAVRIIESDCHRIYIYINVLLLYCLPIYKIYIFFIIYNFILYDERTKHNIMKLLCSQKFHFNLVPIFILFFFVLLALFVRYICKFVHIYIFIPWLYFFVHHHTVVRSSWGDETWAMWAGKQKYIS